MRVINRHLIKNSPLWVYNKDIVKVIHGYKTINGLELVVEFITGLNKGKVTQTNRAKLSRLKLIECPYCNSPKQADIPYSGCCGESSAHYITRYAKLEDITL